MSHFGPFPGSLFRFLPFQSMQLRVNKNFQWLDLNCGTLLSEATAIPTVQQPVLRRFLYKLVILGLFLFIFVVIDQTIQLLQIIWDKCTSSIRCQELNPQPLEHDSSLINTRPDLSHRLFKSKLLVRLKPNNTDPYLGSN